MPRTKTAAWVTLTARPEESRGHGGDGGAYREDGRDHVAVRPAIVFRREGDFDRLAKKIHLSREVQTGDASFDAEVYVDSDSPDEAVRRTLAEPALRSAVRDLLGPPGVAGSPGGGTGIGAFRLELVPDGLRMSRFVPDGPLGAEAVLPALDTLVRAAKALPTFEHGRADRPSMLRAYTMALTAIAFAFVVVGSSVLPTQPVIGGLGAALGLSAATWLLPVLAGIALLRGRSDAHHRALILALTGLSLPVLTFGALRRANVDLDESAPVGHVTTVTRTYSYAMKRGVRCLVTFAPWRKGEEALEIDAPCPLTSQLRAGDRVTVTTRAGRLGWEQVVAFTAPYNGGEARYDILSAALTSTGTSAASSKSKSLVVAEEYRAAACACKDPTCVKDVAKRYTEKLKETAGTMGGSEEAAFAEALTAASVCVAKGAIPSIPRAPSTPR
jgi:hypothetical protein